jgi:hypothetical protein
MLAARGRYVLFSDADLSTPIEEVSGFLPYFEDGYDVVIGSRASHRSGAPMIRKVMAGGFIALRRLIVDVGGVGDTQCGFKCFRRTVVQTLCAALQVYRGDLTSARGATVSAGFDVELLYLANRLGCRIAEVLVQWEYVGTRRVDPIRESWRGLNGLLAIRLNDLRGRYRGLSLAGKRAALH